MDDLYPNNGEYFQPTEPEEQKKERSAEKAQAQEGMQLLEKLITEYEEDEAHHSSIDSIHVDPKTKIEEFQAAWLANQQIKAFVVKKKEHLMSLRDQYR